MKLEKKACICCGVYNRGGALLATQQSMYIYFQLFLKLFVQWKCLFVSVFCLISAIKLHKIYAAHIRDRYMLSALNFCAK